MTRRSPRLAGVAALALTFAAASLFTRTAEAQEGGDKAGNMMANFRFGPAFGLGLGSFTQFTLQPEFGYGFPVADRVDVYAVFTPTFGLGGGTVLMTFPLGAQVDIGLPVEGLYVYPRFSMGPTIETNSGTAAFTLIFEGGAKYVLNKQIHFGFEPLSIPIYIRGGTFTQYRLNFYAGINF